MWSMIIFTVIFYLADIRTVKTDSNLDTLKLVILIHRHGDRTPIELYPRDPYLNETKYWPDGLGELTLNGKNRMYNLGIYLSERYGKFLGNSPREVHVRSSGADRCLDSASLVLAGLYRPNGHWKWNDNLGKLWQPIPIQTVPFDKDGMLNPGSKCKRAEQIKNDIYNSKVVNQYKNEMKSTLLYVEDNTGVNGIDLIKAEHIFDTLFIEKLNQYKLPAWVDYSVYQNLKDIALKTFIFDSFNREIQKFRTGLLLDDIRQHFSKSEQNKRLVIYSTHDTQISIFLSALDEFNNQAPPFGSAVIFELHQNLTQEPYLKAFYLNVTESKSPYQLKLNSCLNVKSQSQSTSKPSKVQLLSSNHDQCTLSKFFTLTQPFIVKNWEVECQNIRSKEYSDDLYFVLVTILLTISLMALFMLLWLKGPQYRTAYHLLMPVN